MAAAAKSGIVFDLQTVRPGDAAGGDNSGGARIGRFAAADSGISFNTPSFVAQTSRGAVPHLSGDNLKDHTDVRVVYVALEDCESLCFFHSFGFRSGLIDRCRSH